MQAFFKGELMKYYLFVFDKVLIGCKAHGCNGKVKVARRQVRSLKTPNMYGMQRSSNRAVFSLVLSRSLCENRFINSQLVDLA